MQRAAGAIEDTILLSRSLLVSMSTKSEDRQGHLFGKPGLTLHLDADSAKTASHCRFLGKRLTTARSYFIELDGFQCRKPLTDRCKRGPMGNVCKFKKTVDGREGHREWNTQFWPTSSKKGLAFGKICFHPPAGFAQDSVAATVSAIEKVLSPATALSVMSNAAD